MIDELFEKLNGALSVNTLRAYSSDYAHFESWCQQRDINPFSRYRSWTDTPCSFCFKIAIIWLSLYFDFLIENSLANSVAEFSS